MAGEKESQTGIAFEVTCHGKRGRLRCLCWLSPGGDLYASPKLIGVSDALAMTVAHWDGYSYVVCEGSALVPVSWMAHHKPELSEDIDLFRERADRALGDAVNRLPGGLIVYAVSDGFEHHKIGVASNIERRIGQLQTGSPRKIELSSYVECRDRWEAFAIESAAKRSLESCRAIGEWFRCNSWEAIEALYEAVDHCRSSAVPVEFKIVIDNPAGG